MKVVYIAGPFRAATPWLVEQNIRRAEEAALEVAKYGLVPLCPHTMYRHFNGEGTDEYWLQATLELLRRCDAVYLLEGWEDSAGSRGEVAEANRLQIRVSETLHHLASVLHAEAR